MLAVSLLGAFSAQALPSLQLGPGAGSWTYDNSTQTWVTSDDPLELLATANATAADGGNGSTYGGSGSGGRIALYYDEDVFGGVVSADGGGTLMIDARDA